VAQSVPVDLRKRQKTDFLVRSSKLLRSWTVLKSSWEDSVISNQRNGKFRLLVADLQPRWVLIRAIPSRIIPLRIFEKCGDLDSMNANALLLPGVTPVHGHGSSNGQFSAFPDIAALPDAQLTMDWTPVLQLLTWAYLVAYLIAYVKFVLPEMFKVGQALSERGWISRVQE
jgi:hypothetical protein